MTSRRSYGAKGYVCELDSGSCSARLQAGICLNPGCPPEGGRYKSAAILSFHTDSSALGRNDTHAIERRTQMDKRKSKAYTRGFSFILLAAPLVPTSATLVRAQNLDALYEKAKTEGALVLYTGGPTAPWEATAKEFSARYPGVTVSVTGGFSNVLDKKIDAQLAAGKLET